jgi:hypothetical protein
MQPHKIPAYFGPVMLDHPSLCETESQNLPPGFQALARRQRLSIEVIRAIQRIESALSKPHINWNIRDSPPAMYNNFAEALPSLGRTRQDGEPLIDSLLCLGLILYCSFEFSSLPVWQTTMLWSAMSRCVRADLTLQILSCKKRRDEPEEACLQWLCMVAIGSWRQSDRRVAGDGQVLIEFMRRRWQATLDIAGRFFGFRKIEFEVQDFRENASYLDR